MIILQKFIADSGYCSRRKAEELIRQGKVTVNGKRAELGMKAEENNEVRVKGRRLILAKEKIYIILNKPRGFVCTNRKFPGERNVFELVKTKERLFVVGRLDKDSRGLVLLSNDGQLTLKLEHPRYQHEKVYEVKIKNLKAINLKPAGIEVISRKLIKGIDIGEGDGVARAKSARYLGENKFKIVLTEGKKRQIRRMFKALGYEADDIVRTAIGRLELDNLPEGEWRYLTNEEAMLSRD